MINRRFLNYKHYESFLRDLNNEEISQDAIVFIQDESHPCIWTHGKEYLNNLSTTSLNDGTLSFGDGYGNTLFTITLDGSNLTITDSEGNLITTQYVLASSLQRSLNQVTTNIQSSLNELSNSFLLSLNELSSNSLLSLNTAVSAKQNTLTAGDGITIDNDTISTTYKHVFLEQEEYDALESYDRNTLYFIYEESDEPHPSDDPSNDDPSNNTWGFGDSFPIILTDDTWGLGDTFPIILT